MWSTIYLGTFRSGGEGDNYKPIMRRAIEPGGHIKTGLELHYSPTAIRRISSYWRNPRKSHETWAGRWPPRKKHARCMA
jgi:hypothetical protein